MNGNVFQWSVWSYVLRRSGLSFSIIFHPLVTLGLELKAGAD